MSGLSEPEWLPIFAAVYEGLAEIEAAAGAPAPALPDPLTGADVEAVTAVAATLRARRQTGRISDLSLTFAPGARSMPAVGAIVNDLTIEQTMVARIFGHEVPVARQRFIPPPMIVESHLLQPDGSHAVKLLPLAGSAVELVIEVIPLSEADPSTEDKS